MIVYYLDDEGVVVSKKTVARRVAWDFSSDKPVKTTHYSSVYNAKGGAGT